MEEPIVAGALVWPGNIFGGPWGFVGSKAQGEGFNGF